MNAFRTLALGLSVFSFAFSTPATSGDGGKAPCTAQASADVKIVPTADLPCDVTMGPALLLSFGVLGGGGDSVTFGGLTADAFLPLGNQFALQLDGDVALGKNDFSFAHTAAHALYRDGGALSLGLYGDWAQEHGGDAIYRAGGEFGVHGDHLWLDAVGGWTSSGKHSVFADTRLGYRAGASTMLYSGVGYDSGTFGKLGFEHSLSAAGDATLFAEGEMRSTGDLSGKIGVRMNFGGAIKNACARPQHGAAFSPVHWSTPRAATGVLSSSGTHACTLTEALKNMGMYPLGDLCFADSPTGTVTNGDISACFAAISCA